MNALLIPNALASAVVVASIFAISLWGSMRSVEQFGAWCESSEAPQ